MASLNNFFDYKNARIRLIKIGVGMNKEIKPIFDWANRIGDANINNRIIAKAMPALIQAKIILTDNMIKEAKGTQVPENIYNIIKSSAEDLLGTPYQEVE